MLEMSSWEVEKLSNLHMCTSTRKHVKVRKSRNSRKFTTFPEKKAKDRLFFWKTRVSWEIETPFSALLPKRSKKTSLFEGPLLRIFSEKSENDVFFPLLGKSRKLGTFDVKSRRKGLNLERFRSYKRLKVVFLSINRFLARKNIKNAKKSEETA